MRRVDVLDVALGGARARSRGARRSAGSRGPCATSRSTSTWRSVSPAGRSRADRRRRAGPRRRAPRAPRRGRAGPPRASPASTSAGLARASAPGGARAAGSSPGRRPPPRARARPAGSRPPWPAGGSPSRRAARGASRPAAASARERAAAREHALGVVGVQPHALLLGPASAGPGAPRCRWAPPPARGRARAPRAAAPRRSAAPSPARSPAAAASSATPVACPWCSGVLRSTASPNARQTRSRPASETSTAGAGSAATAAASGSATSSTPRIAARLPAHERSASPGSSAVAGAPADRLDGGLLAAQRGGTARRSPATCAIRAGCAIASPRSPRGAAAAVPLLVDVGSAGRDARAEPDAAPPCAPRPRSWRGCSPATIARARTAAVPAARSRVASAGRRREVRQVGARDVARIAEVRAHRRALDRDLVAAQQRRRLVRVSRAADVLEQRRVVDVARLLGTGRRGELHGHERGAPGLARLEAHADVGDQRQAGQQLREAQPLHAANRRARADPYTGSSCSRIVRRPS